MAVKLSILVCSTHNRYDNFLQNILDELFSQWEALPNKDEVEILALVDNKMMVLGDKRSRMVEIAQGERVAFVDCDDRLEKCYIKELLKAAENDPDIIVFKVSVSLNGGAPKPCYYSKDYHADHNMPDAYYRLPNHLMCVKRELALQVKFQSVGFGEDGEYAKRLKPLLMTEHNLNKTLYHYDFNSATTETQNKK